MMQCEKAIKKEAGIFSTRNGPVTLYVGDRVKITYSGGLTREGTILELEGCDEQAVCDHPCESVIEDRKLNKTFSAADVHEIVIINRLKKAA